MVIVKKGKILIVEKPESKKRTLLDKYRSLRKEMIAAGIKVPRVNTTTTGRKKWLSGAYGQLVKLAIAKQ